MATSGSGSATAQVTSPDFTLWPTTGDVLDRLAAAGITLRTGVDTTRLQGILDAIVAEVGYFTGRQFLMDTVDNGRYFDGSGTPTQEIDEIVALTSAQVIGVQADPGYSLSDVTTVIEQRKPITRLVLARGSLPALAASAVWHPVVRVFPVGRQNILVTGRWGFAARIPRDLWEAVAMQAAFLLGNEALFQPGYNASLLAYTGRMVEWRESDGTSVQYDKDLLLNGLRKSMPWADQFKAALQRYRRPAGKRLRHLQPAMI